MDEVSNPDEWHVQETNIISTSERMKVSFEASTTDYRQVSGIAVDDVYFKDYPCPLDRSCDFQNSFCTWKNDLTDGEDWYRLHGASPDWPNSGSDVDHTYNTDYGIYIHVYHWEYDSSPITAILKSTVFTADVSRCFGFYYVLFGYNVGSIEIQVLTDISPTPWSLKTLVGDSIFGWKQALVPILPFKEAYSYQILLVAHIGIGGDGEQCVDDITLEDRDCSDLLAPENQGCDFENDFCLWTQGKSSSFSGWIRASGEMQTDRSPGSDHTFGDERGFYVYLDGYNGEWAQLTSSRMLQTSQDDVCLEFWYQSYGWPSGNRLTVYVQTSDGLTTVWEETEPMGPHWTQGLAKLRQSGEFVVIFEGVHGKGYDGVLVLDDIDFTIGECKIPNYCGFENGQCGFNQSPSDALLWQLSSSDSSSSQVIPPYDSTFQLPLGHFMFLDLTDVQNVNQFGLLESGVYSQGLNPDRCLTVWMYMYTSMDIDLTVSQVGVPSGSAKVIISYSGVDLPHEWLVSQIQLSVDENFKITFLVKSLDIFSDGSVSLDDFKVEDGPCPVPGTCDFEDGFCLWKNEVDMDDFDWILYRGLQGTGADSGPYGDHTKANQEGVYAIISPPGHSVQDYAILKSPEFLADSTQCLKFYTYLNDELTGRLDVQVLPSTDTVGEVVLSLEGKQGPSWKESLVSLNITDTEAYVILFNASVGAVDAKANIAIDDIAFYPGECTGLTDVCHFTSGFCDWMQEDEIDEFDWLVGSGADTRYGNNKELPDHSFGTVQGGYAYIDMRDARNQPGDRARLVSWERSSPRDAQAECLTFWYHQDAEAVSLNIYMQWVDNGTTYITDDPLWSTIGNKGDHWWFGGATLISKFPYQAVIEGKMGAGDTGGLTIDDVEFRTGPCDPKGHCNFDHDMCSWRNAADDGIDDDEIAWRRASGSTESTGTGPTNDHTRGTKEGFYMYVDGSFTFPWSISTLYSEIFDKTTAGGGCFSFWYHWLKSSVVTTPPLTVYLRQYSPPTVHDPQVMFEASGESSEFWRRGQFDVESPTDFQILFQASLPSTDDFAIDDTVLTTSPCEEPNLWDCTFEDGECGYTQVDDDEFDWSPKSGDTSSSLTGPSFDHTLGTCTYSSFRTCGTIRNNFSIHFSDTFCNVQNLLELPSRPMNRLVVIVDSLRTVSALRPKIWTTQKTNISFVQSHEQQCWIESLIFDKCCFIMKGS
ncbi:MAM and LDL-receptor class A domain-containing protein 1-like [Lytechinus variegatus]|uniref:MAM and LDL-receptor class A domain-containing protein 1-like n=1 Tax=Lytechinus variegatus TaxID=7654 RepID=UPI001BB25D87|nr:MAM and LDL-receptor class A domain-containing protein 1-like [Lytechinus variegatus]